MNQNGGIHKGGFAVLCHRNGGSESPGILTSSVKSFFTIYPYSISFKNYLRGYVRQNFVNFLIKTLQDAKY